MAQLISQQTAENQRQEWRIGRPATWPIRKKLFQAQEQEVTGASIQIFDSVGRVDKVLLWLFEMVSSLAVLLLAFGLITSQTNVQTHGLVLSNNEWMQQAWAWTQNIAIDMSLLGAIIRACVYWLEKERLKALLYTILSGLLLFTAAIVSNVEAVQQSIEHISLTDAYGKVIFPVSIETLTAVRSLAIVLILVAHAVQYVSWYHAKYRARKQAHTTQTAQVGESAHLPVTQPAQASEIEKVLESVAVMNQQTLHAVQSMNQQHMQVMQTMNQQAMRDVAEQVSQMNQQVINETLNRFTATVSLFGLPVQSGRSSMPLNQENTSTTEELEALLSPENPRAFGFEKSYKEEIEGLLVKEPEISDREIAQRVGCSVRTANRWRARIQQSVL
jgi:hypothetical protein